MNYLSNYEDIRNKFSYFSNAKRLSKLLEAAKTYSRADASGLNNAARTLHEGFTRGFNGLRNTGTENSGEVERLKKGLRSTYLDTRNKLLLNEYANLYNAAAGMKPQKVKPIELEVTTPSTNTLTGGLTALAGNGGNTMLLGGRAEAPSIVDKETGMNLLGAPMLAGTKLQEEADRLQKEREEAAKKNKK